MQIQGPSLIQTQTQKLSPQMLQTVKLMAMPLTDLRELISQELDSNPALEARENQGDEVDSFGDLDSADVNIQEESSDSDYKYNSSESSINDFIEGTVSQEESLIDHLLEQLHLSKLSEIETNIGEIIINNLDHRGYHIHDPMLLLNNYREETVLNVIDKIQKFDPIGICVKDLGESLLVQAKYEGAYPDYTLDILREDIELLENGKKRAIEEKYNITRDELDEVYEYLRTLNPHPTSQFSSGRSNYIIPEARIKKEGKNINVYLKEDTIPSLSINDEIKNFSESDNKEARKFAKKNINEASQFINAISMRNSTLLKTLNAIVKSQREFFLLGPGNIKPLTRKEIAQETELSESTISRISSDKYVETDWGIFNVKYFFSNAVSTTQSGRSHSKESVKEIVKQIILENKSEKKLSDQKISNILKERGINLARRTVSKYRKELNLLSSFERH